MRNLKTILIAILTSVLTFALLGYLLFTFFDRKIKTSLKIEADYAAAQSKPTPPTPPSPSPTPAPQPQTFPSEKAPGIAERAFQIMNSDTTDPVVVRAKAIRARRAITNAHRPVLNALQIDDPKIRAQVIDLLASRALSQRDARNLIDENGLKTTADTETTIAHAGEQELEAIKQLLGEEKTTQLLAGVELQHEITNLTFTVASDMDYYNAPLTDAQLVKLAATIKKTNYSTTPVPTKLLAAAMKINLSGSINDVIKDAQSYLSDQQIAILRAADNDKIALGSTLFNEK